MQLSAPERGQVASRWSITRITAYHWSKSGKLCDTRRLQAAVRANVYNVPHWENADLASWLTEHGVTRNQLAEFFGYNADSLRRFYHDPTNHQRLIDMVSYYKEVANDVSHPDHSATT